MPLQKRFWLAAAYATEARIQTDRGLPYDVGNRRPAAHSS